MSTKTAPASTTYTVRRPVESDLPGLVDMVNTYARRGDLLPRSEESIRRTLSNWVIAIADPNPDGTGGRVIACGSLLLYSSILAEVRSLAVADEAQGTGLGRKVVEALIADARALRITTLFALTRAVGFFERLGFVLTEKEFFPQKVWNDCSICPLKEACDETAVVLDLEGVKSPLKFT